MMRGLVERLLNLEQMDQWFEQFAQEQYTRELLFSTVVSLMLEVVCGPRKSVNQLCASIRTGLVRIAYLTLLHSMNSLP